jgi:hypothetical protein
MQVTGQRMAEYDCIIVTVLSEQFVHIDRQRRKFGHLDSDVLDDDRCRVWPMRTDDWNQALAHIPVLFAQLGITSEFRLRDGVDGSNRSKHLGRPVEQLLFRRRMRLDQKRCHRITEPWRNDRAHLGMRVLGGCGQLGRSQTPTVHQLDSIDRSRLQNLACSTLCQSAGSNTTRSSDRHLMYLNGIACSLHIRKEHQSRCLEWKLVDCS